MFVFFFSSRRRHTRLQGDWSSDVCSSDLEPRPGAGPADATPLGRRGPDGGREPRRLLGKLGPQRPQIGRASCRERGEKPGGDGEGTKKETRENELETLRLRNGTIVSTVIT